MNRTRTFGSTAWVPGRALRALALAGLVATSLAGCATYGYGDGYDGYGGYGYGQPSVGYYGSYQRGYGSYYGGYGGYGSYGYGYPYGYGGSYYGAPYGYYSGYYGYPYRYNRPHPPSGPGTRPPTSNPGNGGIGNPPPWRDPAWRQSRLNGQSQGMAGEGPMAMPYPGQVQRGSDGSRRGGLDIGGQRPMSDDRMGQGYRPDRAMRMERIERSGSEGMRMPSQPMQRPDRGMDMPRMERSERFERPMRMERGGGGGGERELRPGGRP